MRELDYLPVWHHTTWQVRCDLLLAALVLGLVLWAAGRPIRRPGRRTLFRVGLALLLTPILLIIVSLHAFGHEAERLTMGDGAEVLLMQYSFAGSGPSTLILTKARAGLLRRDVAIKGYDAPTLSDLRSRDDGGFSVKVSTFDAANNRWTDRRDHFSPVTLKDMLRAAGQQP